MTTEEALAAAQVNDTGADEVITIDNDLRTIIIPASITLLGVESDENVQTLHFQMPKTYKGLDLSEFDVRINYMNANNVGDVYAVDDNEVSGENIVFTWTVGRVACMYKGNTKFIVCLKKKDVSGNVLKEFNTSLASLPVLEGLETTEAVVAENPDIIEQILTRLDNVTEIPQEKISSAVEEYLQKNPVSVPTKLSDLQDDTTHRTVTDTEKESWDTKSDFSGDYNDLEGKPTIPTVPGALPNPHKLTFAGAVTAEYDGSGAVTVTIPEASGGSSGTVRVEKGSTDTTVELEPNKLYIFPEMASLTYTLAEPADASVANEYHFVFKSGSTATELVHPSTVNVGNFSVDADKVYEISILEGLLTSQNWSVS